jgi:hypothetical protein
MPLAISANPAHIRTSMLPFVNIDRLRRFRLRASLALVLLLALAAAAQHRATSASSATNPQVFAGLVLSIERAVRDLESGDRRLSEDPVLLPAALTTVSGLKEDEQRLDEELHSLNALRKELARLDEQIEQSISAARVDEREQTLLRRQWMRLKLDWDERLDRLSDAHLEWVDAVANVHRFMAQRLGRTSVDGETIVFETDDDTREFNRLMHGVAVAAEGIARSNQHFKVAMKTAAEEAMGSPARESPSMLALLRAAGERAGGTPAHRTVLQ